MAEKTIQFAFHPYRRCYVYIHFHPERETEVVYVGKGTRGRAWDDARRCPDHRRWLRDWQNLGYAPDQFVKLVKRNLTSREAETEERKLIASYRNQGALLFNKSSNKKWPARTYNNKWMPDPKFGKLGRPDWLPRNEREEREGEENALSEGEFKNTVERTEDEKTITYDFRPFEGRQQEAMAWYLGHLNFRLSANLVILPSKTVVLLVDTKFVSTRQLDGFVKKLNGAGLPIEVRCASLGSARGEAHERPPSAREVSVIKT